MIPSQHAMWIQPIQYKKTAIVQSQTTGWTVNGGWGTGAEWLQWELRRIEGEWWIRGCVPEWSVTMVCTSGQNSGWKDWDLGLWHLNGGGHKGGGVGIKRSHKSLKHIVGCWRYVVCCSRVCIASLLAITRRVFWALRECKVGLCPVRCGCEQQCWGASCGYMHPVPVNVSSGPHSCHHVTVRYTVGDNDHSMRMGTNVCTHAD